MKQALLDFVALLRQSGLRPAPGELLDALQAAALVGLDPRPFREALAACLVKDEAGRPAFDRAFEAHFGRGSGEGSGHEEGAGDEAGVGQRAGGAGSAGEPPHDSDERAGAAVSGGGAVATRPTPGRTAPRSSASPGASPDRPRLDEGEDAEDGEDVSTVPRDEALAERLRREGRATAEARSAAALAERARLSHQPFSRLRQEAGDGVAALAEALARRFRARLLRRHRRSRRGRLDLRATAARARARAGVPFELVRKRRRTSRPDLLALVDLSHSTAAAASFLLALVEPARASFRRVTVLGFVDHPVPVALESSLVVPDASLDPGALSDFGRVLEGVVRDHARRLTRRTAVLILGDARNNRRPHRADLLRRLRREVRVVVWLNPDLPARWDTGDSDVAAYRPHVDLLLGAHDPATLAVALDRASRRILA